MTTSSKTNMNEDLKKDFEQRYFANNGEMSPELFVEVWSWIQTAMSKAYETGYEDGTNSGHADVVAYLDSDETDWNKAIDEAISKAREEERERMVKEIKDFVGDPGEVNGPWLLPVKTLFTFLDKLLTQKK